MPSISKRKRRPVAGINPSNPSDSHEKSFDSDTKKFFVNF